MQISIQTHNNVPIAWLEETGYIIRDLEDAVDVLGNSDYLGARRMILKKEQIDETFFDLKSGFAGEVLQKFSNYRMRLAIVGDFSGYTSKSLRDFINESNRTGHILFVPSMDAAMEELGKK
ncbi:MAG: DUF4180 domain-containing protein [Bacteroidales bacterium]|nr:DUF4180 domain-containing protein [Bacteroidales bacterium]